MPGLKIDIYRWLGRVDVVDRFLDTSTVAFDAIRGVQRSDYDCVCVGMFISFLLSCLCNLFSAPSAVAVACSGSLRIDLGLRVFVRHGSLRVRMRALCVSQAAVANSACLVPCRLR